MIPNCKGRAFTLVEVLLALTLTAVVMTLVGRIAVQSLNLTKTIEQQRDEHHRRAYWRDRMDRDLASAIDLSRSVTANLDAHGRPRIRIMALAADSETVEVASDLPTEVEYRVLRTEDHLRLVRESRSLLRSQAVVASETLACGMQSIDVEMWIEGTWLPVTNNPGKRQPKPEAIRITVQWPDQSLQQRTWRLKVDTDRRPRRGR